MTAGFEVPYVSGKADAFKNANERAFYVLISTVISLRTKDKVTGEASERLFALARTPQEMLKISQAEIERALYPAGFYRVKAGNIRKICQILSDLSDKSDKSDQSDYRVPKTIEKLTALPGVGRKTANLVLTEGFHKPGICVDTHVHRILNRLSFVKTKAQDETEQVLRKILPRKFWRQINYYLVMFGQNVCKPVGPRCAECLLNDLCQFACARSKITHVIFDWAGTLYDDHRPSFITSQQSMKRLSGRTLTFADYKKHFTIPVMPFYRRFGVTAPLDVINKTFFDIYAEHYQDGKLFAGVRPALKLLHAHGITMSILSTLRQDYLDKLIKIFKLQKYFTYLHGSVNDKRKEMKEHLKVLSQRHDVATSRLRDKILFVGDTDHDIDAAQKNGLSSGCVLNGYHHPERLKKMKPDFVWKNQKEWVRDFTLLTEA